MDYESTALTAELRARICPETVYSMEHYWLRRAAVIGGGGFLRLGLGLDCRRGDGRRCELFFAARRLFLRRGLCPSCADSRLSAPSTTCIWRIIDTRIV